MVVSVFLRAGLFDRLILFLYAICVLLSIGALTKSFRTKTVWTKRARTTYFVSVTIPFVATMTVTATATESIALLTSAAIVLCQPVIFFFSVLPVTLVFERKNKKFIQKAERKLRASNAVTIGITGSFGKTGCKNILAAMLSERFSVLATEKNYNTPMGIALSVEKMKGDEDYFIAEMGAKKQGDITELCDLVCPDYSIVTGVCPQHLTTFSSLHNVYLEKSVLPKRTKTISVLNGDDPLTKKMYDELSGKKILVGKGGDAYAEDVKITEEGCSFRFYYRLNSAGEFRSIPLRTKLLGRHNVTNICLCAVLALQLGVTEEEIEEAVRTLRPVPHRLEYSYRNGIHILDDGYNGNVVGVKSAMEVLDAFSARKIIVSQGIAEAGRRKKEINEEIGETTARHADVLIFCGPNRKDLVLGARKIGFTGEIYLYKDLPAVTKDLREIVKTGDVVLFQNDVPDTL